MTNLSQPNTSPTPYIYLLEGQTLKEGWTVKKRISSRMDELPAGLSGGHFSVCYVCEKDGVEAFLKVFDIIPALQSSNPFEELNKVITAYQHESFLIDVCKKAGMTRVVRGYLHEQSAVSDPAFGGMPLPLCYIIFESADGGDLRKFIKRTGDLDLAIVFRMLHQVAIGINQLHKSEIAHQDLKPSNVGIFEKNDEGAKIIDLGRASSPKSIAIHDSFLLPGDRAYAPPEQHYQHVPGNFNNRRASCDLYQLGSLLSFLVTGQYAAQGTFSFVDAAYHPKTGQSEYPAVLPFVQDGFSKWLSSIEPHVPSWCRTETMRLIRYACDPDYTRRGDPKARAQYGSPIGMDRFVAAFANLTKLAEVHVRISGAKRT